MKTNPQTLQPAGPAQVPVAIGNKNIPTPSANPKILPTKISAPSQSGPVQVKPQNPPGPNPVKPTQQGVSMQNVQSNNSAPPKIPTNTVSLESLMKKTPKSSKGLGKPIPKIGPLKKGAILLNKNRKLKPTPTTNPVPPKTVQPNPKISPNPKVPKKKKPASVQIIDS